VTQQSVIPIHSRRQGTTREPSLNVSREQAAKVALQVERAPDNICRLLFLNYEGEYATRRSTTDQLCLDMTRRGVVDKGVIKSDTIRLGIVKAAFALAVAARRIIVIHRKGSRLIVKLSDSEYQAQLNQAEREQRARERDRQSSRTRKKVANG